MRPLKILAITLLIIAAPATTAIAEALPFGYFKVSTSINQDLSWSVPGQTVGCGTYVGAGRTTFSFKSKKPTKILVNSTTIGEPGYIKGGGPQSGTMNVYAVPNCNHAADLVQPVSGCGTMSFTPGFSFKGKGKSTYLVSRTGTSDYDDRNFDCAFYAQISSFEEGTIDQCGLKEDGNLEIYNEALRSIGAEGITSAKFPFNAKKLLKIKKGKSKTYVKRLTIKCRATTMTGFFVDFDGKLKASLTFKRIK